MENLIQKTDLIKDVFLKYPQLREAFIQKAMRCVGCEIVEFETIADSCKNHCMQDVDDFVAYLNSCKDQKPVEAEDEID